VWLFLFLFQCPAFLRTPQIFSSVFLFMIYLRSSHSMAGESIDTLLGLGRQEKQQHDEECTLLSTGEDYWDK
jgi:hypothetical protein